MRSKTSIRYHQLDRDSRSSSDSSEESNFTKSRVRRVKKQVIPELFVNRYFPDTGVRKYDCSTTRSRWSTCPLNAPAMVSRRKILSRSRDGLNSDYQDEDDDIWFQKERLVKDHIQEVLNKWKQIDDEIWAKVIVMERNRRVAKAYARAPVLTINGSDDGFDGYRIGLCGFDNPMRDAKTEEIKKHIGHGIKIKMDDGGNIMVKRISKSNIYVKKISTEETGQSTDADGNLLEFEKPVKIFDMKKFAESVNMEFEKAYPDRRKLESKCISVVSFVKDNPEVLDCSCWIMIINIVALDMLRTKLPQASKTSTLEPIDRRQLSQEEDPYSIPFTISEVSVFNVGTLRDPKPPKLPPRDIERVHVPMPDYDDWKPEKPKNKKPQRFGYKDDPCCCGMRARVPNFKKKTAQHQVTDNGAPVRKSHSSGYLGRFKNDGSLDSKRENSCVNDDEHFRMYGKMRSAPSHSQGMYLGEWESLLNN